MTNIWKWWASEDQERMTIGPCDTEAEAIEAAIEEELGFMSGKNSATFYVTEAMHKPIILADHINFDRLLSDLDEVIDENFGDAECGHSLMEGVTLDGLSEAMEAAARKWQIDNAVVVLPWSFTEHRNKSIHTVVMHDGVKVSHEIWLFGPRSAA